MRLGIDVSNNNGRIDWGLVARSGVGLAMVKVTEGVSFLDGFAQYNLDGALANGLMVGAYHFARPSKNGAMAEARFFARELSALPSVELVAVDFEDDQVAGGVSLAAWASDFLEQVEGATGHTSRLYTNSSYLRDHQLMHVRDAERYPLWLAAWTSTEPTSPAPWLRVNGWQFEAGSTWPGIDAVDLSIWDF